MKIETAALAPAPQWCQWPRKNPPLASPLPLPTNVPRSASSPVRYKVIEGALYRREPEPASFRQVVHDLGHGHVEATSMPQYWWGEVGDLDALAYADLMLHFSGDNPPTEEDLLQRLTENRDRSTRRARTKVRRLVKAKNLTDMITLTYREEQTDRVRMSRDFDVFMKRVRRVLPGFEYVCVFERQDRGAWHAHIAVQRVQMHYVSQGVRVRSYDLFRSLWRAVVGTDNGNIDVARGKAARRSGKSTAKLAGYLSKYIGKALDGADKFQNSYSASGKALPKPVVFSVMSASVMAGVAALLSVLSPEVSASAVPHHFFIDGGGYFLCLCPPAT